MTPNFAYAENWYKIKLTKSDFCKIFLILVLFVLTTKPTLADSAMEIFSDQNFSNSTTQFLVGETVYLKIESDDPGERERVVRLKDNQYQDISTFQLTREGNLPYIYKLNFPTPSTAGFYSVEATISSLGSQNKLVKTIQVGLSAAANTRINVRAQVQGTKSQKTPTPTPTAPSTNQPSPTVTPEVQLPKGVISTPSARPISFWQKIVQFFQSIFKFAFRF